MIRYKEMLYQRGLNLPNHLPVLCNNQCGHQRPHKLVFGSVQPPGRLSECQELLVGAHVFRGYIYNIMLSMPSQTHSKYVT